MVALLIWTWTYFVVFNLVSETLDIDITYRCNASLYSLYSFHVFIVMLFTLDLPDLLVNFTWLVFLCFEIFKVHCSSSQEESMGLINTPISHFHSVLLLHSVQGVSLLASELQKLGQMTLLRTFWNRLRKRSNHNEEVGGFSRNDISPVF